MNGGNTRTVAIAQAGRGAEAKPIEAELRLLLAVADADHPIVRRLATVAAGR